MVLDLGGETNAVRRHDTNNVAGSLLRERLGRGGVPVRSAPGFRARIVAAVVRWHVCQTIRLRVATRAGLHGHSSNKIGDEESQPTDF